MPDDITKNLKNLKQVRFLNNEKDQLPTDARRETEKTTQLAQQYLNRQKNVSSEILKVINQQKIVQMEIVKKNERDRELEAKRKAELRAQGKDPNSIAGLLNSIEEEKENQENKLADGFVRSERNMQLRVRDGIDDERKKLEEEKTALQQKVNDALLKLDRFNQRKRDLSNKLAEQIGFVRDLQKATGGAGLEDVNSVASAAVTGEINQEKQMKKQLQDQLLRAEQEHIQLLNRLHLYTGDKDVVCVQHDGHMKTFKVTSLNISKLLDEVQQTKMGIVDSEHDIMHAKEILQQCEQEINEIDQQLFQQGYERDKLCDKITEMQIRHDHAQSVLENEKKRTTMLHRMHVKLLAIRILEESLQKVIGRNQEIVFVELLQVWNRYRKRNNSLKALQKVLTNGLLKIKKRSIQKWYKAGCDPLKMSQLTDAVPLFFIKQTLSSEGVYKWPQSQQSSPTIEICLNSDQDQIITNQAVYNSVLQKQINEIVSLKRSSSCNKIYHYTQKCWKRRLTCYFLFWRVKVTSFRDKLSVLRKVMLSRAVFQQFEAMSKWRQFITDQDINVRFAGLGVTLTRQQVQLKVVHVLQSNVLYRKMARVLKMGKALKLLKQNKEESKQSKLIEQWFHPFYTMKSETQTIMEQNLFYKWRYYTLRNKLKKDLSILSGDVHVKIRHWKQYIDEKEKQIKKQKMLRAFKKIHIFMFMVNTASSFRKWKSVLTFERFYKKHTLHLLIIKVYKRKLLHAKLRWRQACGQIINYLCTKNIELIQDHIRVNEKQILRAKIELEEKKQISLAKARQCYRRILSQFLQKYLHSKLKRWKYSASTQTRIQQAGKTMMYKLRNQYLRIAFTKYRRGTALCIQEDFDQRRASEYQQRLNCRAKKRIYNAVRIYALNHLQRIKCIESLFKKFDGDVVVKSMERWKRFTAKAIEVNLFKMERSIVANLQVLQDQLGTSTDNKSQLQNKVDKMQSMLKTEAKHVLQNWVLRLHRGGLRFGLKTWYSQACNKRYKINTLKTLNQHIMKGAQRSVFRRWKSAMENDIINSLNERCQQKQNQINAVQHDILVKRKEAFHQQKKITTLFDKIQGQKMLIKLQLLKCIKMLQRQRQANFIIKNERYMLLKWKEFTRTQVKCFKAFKIGIMKLVVQKALDKIRNYSQYQLKSQQQIKSASKILLVNQRTELRLLLSRWKRYVFNLERYLTQQAIAAKNVEISTHFNNCVHLTHNGYKTTEISNQRSYLLKIFEAWHVYSFDQKVNREKQMKIQGHYEGVKLKQAVLKWHIRTQLTQKSRKLVQKYKEIQNKYLKKLVLKQGFQRFINVQRVTTRKISIFMSNLKHFQIKTAFKQIKYYSEILTEADHRDKDQAARHIVKKIDLMITSRNWFVIGNLDRNKDGDYQKYLTLKNCLMTRLALKLRSYFNAWKKNAKRIEIVVYNEEEYGPRNLEAWKYRWVYLILKQLVQDDLVDQSLVDGILRGDRERNIYLLKKTILRLMVNSDPDLRIMPVAFLRLKMYAQVRKYWRYIIKVTNRQADRLNQQHQLVARAFGIWRRRNVNLLNELKQVNLYKLQNREYENEEAIECLQKDEDCKNQTFGEYTEQRNALFEGYLKSQKLAFANTKASYHRVAQKAIMKLQDYGTANLKTRIDQALQENLDRISILKDRIGELELSNVLIAQNNDGQRGEALQAISKAREIEVLQDQVDSLHGKLDQNDKYIERLLDEQSWIVKKIEETESYLQLANKQQIFYKNISPINERENVSNAMNGAYSGNFLISQNVNNYNVGNPTLRNSRVNSPLRLKATIHK